MECVIVRQDPLRFVRLAQDVLFFEFDRTAFARLEYQIEMDSDGTVELAVGEVLTADGRLDREPGGYRIFRTDSLQLKKGMNRGFMFFVKHLSPYQEMHQRSKVLVPENIGGEIEPFRFAEVTGQVRNVKLIRHAAFGEFDDNAADFHSGDEKLNRIWDFCKYTIKATSMFNLYVDGERERQVFEGDCYVNALTAYCTGGSLRIARRSIDFLTCFYPIAAIEYRLLTPILIRDYFLYSGDTEIYKYWREEMPEKFLGQFMSEDGLYHYDRDNHNMFPAADRRSANHYQYKPLYPDYLQLLVDWPENERDNYEYGELSFIPHNFLYGAYRAMDELEPGAGYDRKADAVRQAIYKYFYRDNMFFDSDRSSHTAIHTAAGALAFDLAQADDAPALVDLIKRKGMACSPYMSQYLLEGLFKYGGEQCAIDLMRRNDNRSWLGMLNAGATITMEAWNDEVKPNQDWNHAWSSAPGNIIPRYLAGIRPTSFGFKTFDVDPHPGDVKQFSIKQPTPNGTVFMEYDNGHIKLQVPENSIANCAGKVYGSGMYDIKK